MSLEEVDDLCLLSGGVKYRDDKKWKCRHATLRRLSPVANTLHLQLFKEAAKGLQNKASLSLDNFRAMEMGFTLDRESNTLALLCEGSSIVLAFDAREALMKWQTKIAASVPFVQQFSAELLVAPASRRLRPGAARLHVQDLRVSLVTGNPPRLVASWPIADLRRYGPAEGKYVLEGGARCGRGAGLHVLGVTAGQAEQIHAAVEEAAQCRLQSRRKLLKKAEDSPRCGVRRAISRSCSRDGTLASARDSAKQNSANLASLARDNCSVASSRMGESCMSGSVGGKEGISPRESGPLCRQASLQWSQWSSDDCDLEYEPMEGASRANGDGQSEVSVSSSGSESASRRLPLSTSGHSLRSPRPGRRCSADCACAIKTTRCSLRRTGVLDEIPSVQRGQCQSSASLPPTAPASQGRFADHVYEEPKEKPPISSGVSARQPISGVDAALRPVSGPSRPITTGAGLNRPIGGGDTSWRDPTSGVIRTVAQVHGLDPTSAYDRPKPIATPVYTSNGPETHHQHPATPSPRTSVGPATRDSAELPVCPTPDQAPQPTSRRLSPEGVSMTAEHTYEDLGPSEGWYQTPKPCEQCKLMRQMQGARLSGNGGEENENVGVRGENSNGFATEAGVEGLYKQAGCHCVNCGGDKAPVVPEKTQEARIPCDGVAEPNAGRQTTDVPPETPEKTKQNAHVHNYVEIEPTSRASDYASLETPGYETIRETMTSSAGMTSSQTGSVTSSGEKSSRRPAARPKVDGSGRMPVLNANTGELEVPAQSADGSLLCPRIPSEIILGQGLYARPERPAYAVVDKARKTLIPGLAPPQMHPPQVEHDYANTPTSVGDSANHYVNMLPPGATAEPLGGGVSNQYVNMKPLGEVMSCGEHSYTNIPPVVEEKNVCNHHRSTCEVETSSGNNVNQRCGNSPNGALVVNESKSGQYVNVMPQPEPINQTTAHLQYLEMSPRLGVNSRQGVEQEQEHAAKHTDLHSRQVGSLRQELSSNRPDGGKQPMDGRCSENPQSPYTLMAPMILQNVLSAEQHTYTNTQPLSLDASQIYENTPDFPLVSSKPPSGNYLDMSGKGGGVSSLRRSRSVDNGRRKCLRSLSLGRKPMPSPKPERIKCLKIEECGHLARGCVAPPAVKCCGAPPFRRYSGHQSDMTSSMDAACDVITRLDLSELGSCLSSPREALAALKPRSKTQYERVDRSRLLAEVMNTTETPPSSLPAAPSVNI